MCGIEYLKLNPLGYVPTLVDGDAVIADSFAIIMVCLSCALPLECVIFYHYYDGGDGKISWAVSGREVSSASVVASGSSEKSNQLSGTKENWIIVFFGHQELKFFSIKKSD